MEASLDVSPENAFSHRTAAAIVVVVALVAAVAGTATALSFSSLDVQAFELFGSDSSDTDLSITSFEVKVKGEDKVSVDLSAKNQDTTTHRANVTVQVRDSTDAILAEETKATGALAGGGTFSDKWKFDQTDLAVEYDDVFLWIDQSS